MRKPSAGAAFRERLAQGPILLPGVFNAITAQIAEAAGAHALYLSGAGVTNSLTAFPDIALLTLTELAQQARYVCRAAALPVISDADTGFGETLNVARTVEEFEAAGLAGMHLEDQVSPKRCGHLDGKQVISTLEMSKKIRAADLARTDTDFYIIARTDARSVNGFDDAVNRAHSFMDSGADAIFVESLHSKDEFESFAEKVKAPIMANMTEFGKTPYISFQEFAEMGYQMVIFPMTAFRMMMFAAKSAYETILNEGTQTSLLEKMQTRAELYELIRYEDYNDFDKQVASEFDENSRT